MDTVKSSQIVDTTHNFEQIQEILGGPTAGTIKLQDLKNLYDQVIKWGNSVEEIRATVFALLRDRGVTMPGAGDGS